MARILQAFEPPRGGVARLVSQLALGLPALGHEVEVAGPADSMIYPDLRAAGIPIHRLPWEPGYGRPFRAAAALGRLTALAGRGRYDLIHLHSAQAGVLGRIAGRLARVPVVYAPSSFPFVGEFSEVRRRFALGLERALASSADVIVCVCESERRLALEQGVAKRDRLRVVYNGCEPCEDDQAPAPELLEWRSDGVTAAAVAELRAQKSVDVLLEAAPLILERVPRARIAIVGDGPLREELHARADALGLTASERFRFFPFHPPAARYLRAIDLYVLPSAWEAFPIGILEAQACGVPQVVTDVGGNGEAVDHQTGIVVPKRDPADLAGAIVSLLSDDARREQLGRASRLRHTDRFTVERMVDETAAVYVDALKGAPVPAESASTPA